MTLRDDSQSPAPAREPRSKLPGGRPGVIRFRTHQEADASMDKYGPRVRTTASDVAALAAALKALDKKAPGEAP